MRPSKWGVNNPMQTSKLPISWLLVDKFWCDFYNWDSLHEMIQMRGNNSMQTSKLHAMLNLLSSLWTDFDDTSMSGILLMRQSKWKVKTYANFKTAHNVECLSSMLTNFYWTSITGILFMRWSKWGATATMLISNLHIFPTIIVPC